MLISEIFFLAFVLLGIVFSPIYLFLRQKMTRSNKPHEYSRKTIFRVVAMHFFMMFVITAIQVAILQSLLSGNTILSQNAIFVVSLQVLFLAASLYGSGIYITSILFETFVTRKYLVIRFLHGPLSHTIVYASYLGIFANLSFISQALGISSTLNMSNIFLGFGILAGIVAATDNLANGILLVSLIVTSIAFALFLFVNGQSNSFAFFFEGYGAGFLTTGISLVVYKFLKKERLSWYQPVNIF